MRYSIIYKLYTPKGKIRVAACQVVAADLLPYILQEYWVLSQNKVLDTLCVVKLGHTTRPEDILKI